METTRTNVDQRRGELLAGKYRVSGILGVGGMGQVLLACHEQLGQWVAIKVMSPESARDAAHVVRFGREARAIAQLRGEHVVRVFDVGALEDGRPYIIMEYLQGCSLRERMQRSGALPVREAVDLVLQAIDGVSEAHAAGIVHRDLKPSNLFLALTPSGETVVKVLDFGISKMGGPGVTGAHLTASSTVLGTAGYISPEQLRSSRDVDARADIWSLGVILYELVAGRRPYEATGFAHYAAQVLRDAPPPLRAVRPDLPEALEHVVMRCLAHALDARYSHLGEVADALAPFASPVAATSLGRTLSRFPVAPRTFSAAVTPPAPKPAGGGAWVIAAVLGLLVAGSASAVGLTRARPHVAQRMQPLAVTAPEPPVPEPPPAPVAETPVVAKAPAPPPVVRPTIPTPKPVEKCEPDLDKRR